MEMIDILLYGAIVAIPLAGIGITKLFNIINDMMKIKKGHVETTILMEGGQYRKKWVKPYSGSAEIARDKKVDFKDGLGFVYRSGNRPMSVVREKDLTQINLSKIEEGEKKVSAEDTSNLIIRAFQQGFIKGFKKNQMMSNLVLYTLLGVGGCLILCVLIMNTSSQILGAVSG